MARIDGQTKAELQGNLNGTRVTPNFRIQGIQGAGSLACLAFSEDGFSQHRPF